MRAYNVEAERLGLTLNVIPPVGAAAAGAGPCVHAGSGASIKRALTKTPAAPAKNKKIKLL